MNEYQAFGPRMEIRGFFLWSIFEYRQFKGGIALLAPMAYPNRSIIRWERVRGRGFSRFDYVLYVERVIISIA